MAEINWLKELEAAVTVSDDRGKIVLMNDASAETFSDWGGRELIGKNLNDCHQDHSNKIIQSLLENHNTNCYITEKEGKKKLVYQQPWFEKGEFAGLVEFILPLPDSIPHFKRD